MKLEEETIVARRSPEGIEHVEQRDLVRLAAVDGLEEDAVLVQIQILRGPELGREVRDLCWEPLLRHRCELQVGSTDGDYSNGVDHMVDQ